MPINDASERAYQYIAKRIETGDFPQGSALSEVEIASTIGSSRSPVREALRRLEAEGLVKRFPGRGTFVSVLTTQDLEEIFQLRLMFELYGLESAITQISDEQIEAMKEAFRAAKRAGDIQAHAEADSVLHAAIVQSCGNLRLQNFMDILSAQIRVVKAISRRIESLAQNSYETHMHILDAMQQRDLALARERLEQHILEVERKTIENMKRIRP